MREPFYSFLFKSPHWTVLQIVIQYAPLFHQYVVLINPSDQNGIQQWKMGTLENEQHCQSLFFCILEEEKKKQESSKCKLTYSGM